MCPALKSRAEVPILRPADAFCDTVSFCRDVCEWNGSSEIEPRAVRWRVFCTTWRHECSRGLVTPHGIFYAYFGTYTRRDVLLGSTDLYLSTYALSCNDMPLFKHSVKNIIEIGCYLGDETFWRPDRCTQWVLKTHLNLENLIVIGKHLIDPPKVVVKHRGRFWHLRRVYEPLLREVGSSRTVIGGGDDLSSSVRRSTVGPKAAAVYVGRGALDGSPRRLSLPCRHIRTVSTLPPAPGDRVVPWDTLTAVFLTYTARWLCLISLTSI
jgi:hypothetical protein